MRQYFDAKRQYRHALLFFRMGDFYEMFYEDALVASRALDLTLTSRSKDASGTAVPMCGVPLPRRRRLHRAAGEERLPRRHLRAGRGSEEGQGRRQARGRARRVAGHADRRSYLDAREPAFLMAIVARVGGASRAPTTASRWSISRPANSTSPNTPAPKACRRCATRSPCSGRARSSSAAGYDVGAPIPEIAPTGVPVTEIDGWHFELETARQTLLDQLRVQQPRRLRARAPAGGGLRGRRAGAPPARHAEGGPRARAHASACKQAADGLLIDPTTLEAPRGRGGDRGRPRRARCSHEIDRTITPMGGRLLRAWLLRPLVALEPIRDRLDAVEELAVRTTERGKVRETLKIDPGSRAADRAHRALDGRAARPGGAARIARRRAPRLRCCWRSARRRSLRSLRRRARRPGRRPRRGSSRPSATSRRRWRATADSSATASTRSSTSCATSAVPASR